MTKLKALGHRIRVVISSPYVGGFARPSGVLLEHDMGLLHGGAEVFGPAIAIGH